LAGAFLSFEGIDGCGKSTQLRLLASHLRQRGVEVVSTREPGGTPLGQQLRHALLEAETLVDPLAELLLYAADRAQHVRTLVRPALEAGQIVLTDRFADATVAYQGAGRGFEPGVVDQIVRLATGGLKPDLTLLFDLPVADARERARQRRRPERPEGDRLEAEDASFHERVRGCYLRLAEEEPGRVRVVESSRSVEEVHRRVIDIVTPFLENRGRGSGAGEQTG
jgi:dTMP kinase